MKAAKEVINKPTYSNFPQNSDWMSTLPEKLHHVTLNEITIPGSHDSASYKFDRNGGVGPDADKLVKDLEKLFGRAVNDIIYRWAKTQNMNFVEQLTAGIRYFDLRVSTRTGYQDLYFLHSLYADKVEDCLNQIDIFLDSHPKEVIILDFNHLYAMTETDHKQLISMLLEIFGAKVCMFLDMASVTLEMMWENKLQVIVIYHHALAVENHMIWPGKCIKSPWANTTDVAKLIHYLESVYQSDHGKENFLSYQGVLTADTSFVLTHLNQSIQTALADRASPAVVKWLTSKQESVKKLNVVIVDFSDGYDFISSVIQMNR